MKKIVFTKHFFIKRFFVALLFGLSFGLHYASDGTGRTLTLIDKSDGSRIKQDVGTSITVASFMEQYVCKDLDNRTTLWHKLGEMYTAPDGYKKLIAVFRFDGTTQMLSLFMKDKGPVS